VPPAITLGTGQQAAPAQAQQAQLHFPQRNGVFAYPIVLTPCKFPAQQQSGCWSLNKPLYQHCSVLLTQREMKLKKRIL